MFLLFLFYISDSRLTEQEALEQIRQLCTQLQHLQDRAPPRGVAIATIATLLETCTTSHQLSLKPPPATIKNPQQNSIRADKSTNTNIVADELCQQIENGFARISITDVCDTKIEDRNSMMCVQQQQQQSKNVKNCENQNSNSKQQQQINCNELAFKNLRLQCMCSSSGGSCCEEEKLHGNNILPITDEQHLVMVNKKSTTINCSCSCNCAENSVHDKYSHLINDDVGDGGCDNIVGNIDNDGNGCSIKDSQHKNRPPSLPPLLLPPPSTDHYNNKTLCANCITNRLGCGGGGGETVVDNDDDNGDGGIDDDCSVTTTRNTLCEHEPHQQHQCNINLTEIKQCDGSIKNTNKQLTKVYLNNLSHVYSHINVSQQLDSLAKEQPIIYTANTASSSKDGNEINLKCDGLCNIYPHNFHHINCNHHNKLTKNILNLSESIEISDDGIPMTPSPTISNISSSLNIISGSNTTPPITTIGCDEKKMPSKQFTVTSSSRSSTSPTQSLSSLPPNPAMGIVTPQQQQPPPPPSLSSSTSSVSPSPPIQSPITNVLSTTNLAHCQQQEKQTQQLNEGDEKLSILHDNNVGGGEFSSCNNSGGSSTTTATTSSSSTTSSTAPIAASAPAAPTSSTTIQPNQITDENNGSVNATKRKKQPDTKLVLDLNDRSKYTKEVSV